MIDIPPHHSVFVIAYDPNPMPWEDNTYPYCIFIGDFAGARAYAEVMEKEKGGLWFCDRISVACPVVIQEKFYDTHN